MITKTGLSRLIGSGMLTVMIVALTACSGPPKWVKQGSNFNDKAFYGVGAVNGVKNEPLAWEAAQNRARAEVARNFETYTAYLMRDYAASTIAVYFTKIT